MDPSDGFAGAYPLAIEEETAGKRLLETNDKYYFEDLGLRNMLAGANRTSDIEKVIENVVYLHLKNLGYKVMVGTLPNGEIDFVAVKDGKTVCR